MLSMIIAILGRQTRLALAELESIYGAEAVQPVDNNATLIKADHVEQARLGGTIKIAHALAELETTQWPKLAAYILRELPKHLDSMPGGKITLGLSAYGLRVNSQQLFRAGLELKKICRAAGRSVRLVPNSTPELNSAQVIHNQLTGPNGLELLFVQNGNKTWLARTLSVQNVEDYARRDHGRPKRDAFVGMLPPKLAQIMLNLAQAQPGERILDPFCGTGVVLQEAALMGCAVYGTDLSERMVRYTRDNMQWLQETYGISFEVLYESADATSATWRPPLDHVICETYLGQPLSGLPKPDKLSEIIQNCDTITRTFLQNLHPQLKPGTRLCIAVPAWRVKGAFKHLLTLDDLKNLGYNRLRFQHARFEDLVYHREDQIVARELLVLTVI